MNQPVTAGIQSFEKIKDRDVFYIDKTSFIREWWESEEDVTLITRPRRFGKTLNMSMLEYFFSSRHAGRGDLFEGLEIWKDEKYRALQGTLPVISVSFSGVKEGIFEDAIWTICELLKELLIQHERVLKSQALSDTDRRDFKELQENIGARNVNSARTAIRTLSRIISKAEGKNVVILLDEYDAPLQEAWMHGNWKQMSSFMRSFFNYTFKSNSYLERGVLTGVTRVSKESMFSDLNNLNVSSILSGQYETSFGFTESEVFAALKQYGLSNREGEVREMYDGFIFGSRKGIYNPWSINKYIKSGGKPELWWSNTSSNDLICDLIKNGSFERKEAISQIMGGGTVRTVIDERIIFSSLASDPDAIWGLLLECGYLKPEKVDGSLYVLAATNKEVRLMFAGLIDRWFPIWWKVQRRDFLRAMETGDLASMNERITKLVEVSVSTFDTGNKPSDYSPPERFFHGLMIGLLAPMHDRYQIHSNDIQGAGRCDIMLVPRNPRVDDGIILEFKVCASPKQMEATAVEACRQIEEMRYDAGLKDAGLPQDRIHKYGFVFHGKDVIIRGK